VKEKFVETILNESSFLIKIIEKEDIVNELIEFQEMVFNHDK